MKNPALDDWKAIDFFSFNPTDEEIRTLFGRSRKEVESDPYIGTGGDGEIYQTACLLAMRGKNRKALKMLEEIKDVPYREDMKRILRAQIELPPGAVW